MAKPLEELAKAEAPEICDPLKRFFDVCDDTCRNAIQTTVQSLGQQEQFERFRQELNALMEDYIENKPQMDELQAKWLQSCVYRLDNNEITHAHYAEIEQELEGFFNCYHALFEGLGKRYDLLNELSVSCRRVHNALTDIKSKLAIVTETVDSITAPVKAQTSKPKRKK